MRDRLDVVAAATLFLHWLLFEGLTAGRGTSSGGAVYLRDNSGAAAVQCVFRGNSAHVRPFALATCRAPPPTRRTPTHKPSHPCHCPFSPIPPLKRARAGLGSSQQGGGIYASIGTALTVTGSTFDSNTAVNVRARPSLLMPLPPAGCSCPARSPLLQRARLCARRGELGLALTVGCGRR